MAQVTTGNRFLLNFHVGNLIDELENDINLEKKKQYTDPMVYSHYTQNPSSTYVTPWISLCNAIWEDLGYANQAPTPSARGQSPDNVFFSERQSASRPEAVIITTYNAKTGKIKSVAYDRNTHKYKKVVIDPSVAKNDTSVTFHTSASYILTALMEKIYSNNEAAECRQEIIDAMTQSPIDTDAARNALLRLSDNVYRRVVSLPPTDPAFIPMEDIGDGRPVPQLTKDNVETARIKVIKGSFTKVGEGTSAVANVSIDYDSFNLGIKHPEGLPVINKQMNGWTPTVEGKEVLEYFTKSKDDPHGRVNNFMFEGPNGTGKTAITRNDVAFALKCTWWREQLHGCFSSEDACGTYYPVAHDEASQSVKDFLASMPSEVEAQLNPVAAYEKVTGKKKDDATALQVLAHLNAKFQEFLLENKEPSTGIELKYMQSPTLLANECAEKYGCAVLCLDEITRAPQEVISIYNGFLEPGGGMQTPNGWVNRSPNLIVIGTANPPETNMYCKKMDESMRQRFQKFYAIEVPSIQKMADLIMGYEYIKDPILADTMATVIDETQQCIKANSIVGAISIRNLVEWARDISYGIDIKQALQRNVIQAVTPNVEEQQMIIDALHQNTAIYAG